MVVIAPLPDGGLPANVQRTALLGHDGFELRHDRAERVGTHAFADCLASRCRIRDGDQPVKMIGHDDKEIKFHRRSDRGRPLPFLGDYIACLAWQQFAIYNFPKEMRQSVCTDCDKVQALGIVVAVKSS